MSPSKQQQLLTLFVAYRLNNFGKPTTIREAQAYLQGRLKCVTTNK